MKPAPFTLHRPTTLADALDRLGAVAEDGGLVIAGGQSLMPMMALRVALPPHLVDINGIDALGHVRIEGATLIVGACVRHSAFQRPVCEGVLGDLLAAVARHIAHYPIRTRGTFCGSLAHADPASEWCLVAVTLGASLRLASASGERYVAASDFIDGAMSTVREPNEILIEVSLRLPPGSTRWGFYEFNRRAGDFALGMALVTCDLDGGLMRNVRVGLGAIEETPRRIAAAEALLEGASPGSIDRDALDAAIAADVVPMQDHATDADYRRDLAGVVVRRAVAQAIGCTSATTG